MENCIPCEEARKSEEAKAKQQLLTLAAKKYKDTPFITIALVRTKNGKIGIREATDESITRKINPLPVIEYIPLMQGAPTR